MKKLLIIALLSSVLFACTNEKPSEKKSQETVMAATPQSEIADSKYIEVGKKALDYFQKGDMDSWMAMYADNAVYQWNNLDSLAGKAAIDEFWRNRRNVILDTIIFSGAIFLPIKVNKPQAGEQAGNWLLTWYQMDARYSNGNSLFQFIHLLYHFDANDKVDRILQFVDRAPINAALAE